MGIFNKTGKEKGVRKREVEEEGKERGEGERETFQFVVGT